MLKIAQFKHSGLCKLSFFNRVDDGYSVEAYEAKHWPLDPVSPRDIFEYAITDVGRSQKKLAELLGSRSQASDLPKGRRKVSLEVAQKIKRRMADSFSSSSRLISWLKPLSDRALMAFDKSLLHSLTMTL